MSKNTIYFNEDLITFLRHLETGVQFRIACCVLVIFTEINIHVTFLLFILFLFVDVVIL